MAITIRHDVAAGLIGSYAAGQAAARSRRQRYALPALLRNQRLRGVGLGAAGARARAVERPAGVWTDPLDDPSLSPRHARAARRARARKYRLGKPIPSEWQPTFKSQEEIDREQELEDERRKFDREDRIRGEEREQDIADAAAAAAAAARKGRQTFARNRLEEGGYSETQKTLGNTLLRDIELVHANTGISEEEKQEKIHELEQQLEEILNDPQGVPELSLEDRWNQDIFTAPDGSKYQWLGPDKGWQELKSSFADARQAAEQKQRANVFTARDNLIKAQEALQKARRTLNQEGGSTQEEIDLLKQRVALREEELEDAKSGGTAGGVAGLPAGLGMRGGAAPPPEAAPPEGMAGDQAAQPDQGMGGQLPLSRPIAPPGTVGGFVAPWLPDERPPLAPGQIAYPDTVGGFAAPVGPPHSGPTKRLLPAQPEVAAAPRLDLDKLNPQHFYDGKLHDAPRPIPEGMPQGSRWFGDDFIQLPNGTLVRPKRR